MKNIFISVIAILTAVPIFGSGLPSQSPIVKQFVVDENNEVIRPYGRVNKQRLQIIAENFEYLRLECQADYPVQWIYTGNGIPIMTTEISFSTILSRFKIRDDDIKPYLASAIIGPLREHHTGKYLCSRTDRVTPTPITYIYVPGRNLFTSLEGKTIKINANVSSTLIPCSVTHPRVQVTLYKIEDGKWTRPNTKSQDAIVYNPRVGFRIKLKKIAQPEGEYICSARYNGIDREVQYNITSDPIPPKDPVSPCEDECQRNPCKECETHTDCGPIMNCYTDFKCRNSCEYSIECGQHSLCRVVNYHPECYCPPGFKGDPYQRCWNMTMIDCYD